MRRRAVSAMLVCALVCLLSSCAFSPKTLVTVEMYAYPTKTVYQIGESADFSGASVRYVYDRGADYMRALTAKEITGFDSSTAGEKICTATVVVDGKKWTTVFVITVRAEATVSVISWPAVLTCRVGARPDTTGGVLESIDENGAAERVDFADCVIECDTSLAGRTVVTVRYAGYAFDYQITVLAEEKPSPPAEEEDAPIDFEQFSVVERQWGGACNAGVIADNVVRDGDDLVLLANGDYYAGPKRGVGDYVGTFGGKRTGAALRSIETYGPGSFEVKMKLADRNGVCNAFWLYNNFPDGGAQNRNFEIDIEIHGTVKGADGFDSVLCTNWLTEKDFAQARASTGALNDGAFHTYRFDWHTGVEPRVEYYVDGARVAVLREKVPTNEMYVWIGAWFPNKWCGTPDFETSAMTVRSFRYTPFDDEEAERLHCERVEGGIALDPAQKPPAPDYIAAAEMIPSPAWMTDGVWQDGLTLSAGYAQQTVNFDCGGLTYRLTVRARGASLDLAVLYYDLAGKLLSRESLRAEASEQSADSAFILRPPEGCVGLTLKLATAGSATITRVSLSLD